MRATFGKGGWIRYETDDGRSFLVRFAEVKTDGDGTRLRPVELHVADPAGLDVSKLRAIPLREIEASVNTFSEPGRRNVPHVKAESLAERLAEFPDSVLVGAEPAPPRRRPQLVIRETRPAGGYPDSFYIRVAKAYGWLAEHSKRPASELAGMNGVPVTTVHRWVKEARRRGHLPPTMKGRIG